MGYPPGHVANIGKVGHGGTCLQSHHTGGRDRSTKTSGSTEYVLEQPGIQGKILSENSIKKEEKTILGSKPTLYCGIYFDCRVTLLLK